MYETPLALDIPPGIARSGTKMQSLGRWYDGHLVRFFDGAILPVGGWARVQDSSAADLAALTGVPRAVLGWSSDEGVPLYAFGTNEKLYVLAAGAMADITPADFTTGDVDSTFESGNYGDGLYGVGPYGAGSSLATQVEAATWQLDSFADSSGNLLVGVCTSENKLRVWLGVPATAAVEPTATGGTLPSDVRGVVMTPERFLVLLGGNTHARRVQWADQESYTDWTTDDATKQGGFIDLATNGKLLCGRRGRGQTLLWTDLDLWSMTYIGGVFVYSFRQEGDQCGIIGPNAVALIDGKAVWMGRNAFFGFDGFVQAIPCEVGDYVFSDMNRAQAAKFFAVPIADFGEVWWFYCSHDSQEIDRYVAFSTRENHWTIGKLSRTAATGAMGALGPVMCDAAGLVWQHEQDNERGSEVPYLESGPVLLGNGQRVMKVQCILPDEASVGDVQAIVTPMMQPNDESAAQPAVTLTAQTDVRYTARMIRLKLQEHLQKSWRVGRFQLGVIPGGTR